MPAQSHDHFVGRSNAGLLVLALSCLVCSQLIVGLTTRFWPIQLLAAAGIPLGLRRSFAATFTITDQAVAWTGTLAWSAPTSSVDRVDWHLGIGGGSVTIVADGRRHNLPLIRLRSEDRVGFVVNLRRVLASAPQRGWTSELESRHPAAPQSGSV